MTEGKDRAYPGEFQSATLTKRELFAAMAMQGIIINTPLNEDGSPVHPNIISFRACYQADSLINELNKTT